MLSSSFNSVNIGKEHSSWRCRLMAALLPAYLTCATISRQGQKVAAIPMSTELLEEFGIQSIDFIGVQSEQAAPTRR